MCKDIYIYSVYYKLMCIINFIYNITLYCNNLLFNIRIVTIVLYICKPYSYNRVV